MSEKFCKDLSLAMPVFRGGGLFTGAIRSIEDSGIPFKNIYISFNGGDSADFDAFENLRRGENIRGNYTIFRTNCDLTASQHGYFFVNQLRLKMDQNDMIMFLAHDDRLLPVSNQGEGQEQFLSSLRSDTVYFPSYNCCLAGDYGNVTHVIEDDRTLTSEEFFWLTMRDNIATNISGMVVPFGAWDSSLPKKKNLGTGARSEHIMCISPGVKYIRYTRHIQVLIGERPDSDGKLISNLEKRKSSLYYIMTYQRNGRLSGCGRYVPFLFQVVKKFFAYALARASDIAFRTR